MWNILKFISLILFSLFFSVARGTPSFYAKNPTISFGSFSANQLQEANYIVFNRGNEELKIFSARSTCSCAKLIFPEYIAPGKSGHVTLSIKENSYSGDFKGKIYLISNDINSPHELIFDGHATPLYTISPSSEFYAGVISKKGKWKKTFIISSKTPDLKFGSPRSKSDFPIYMVLEKNSAGEYLFSLEFSNVDFGKDRFSISVEIPVITPQGWPSAKLQVNGRLCP